MTDQLQMNLERERERDEANQSTVELISMKGVKCQSDSTRSISVKLTQNHSGMKREGDAC